MRLGSLRCARLAGGGREVFRPDMATLWDRAKFDEGFGYEFGAGERGGGFCFAGPDRKVRLRGSNFGLAGIAVHGHEVAGEPGKLHILLGPPAGLFTGVDKKAGHGVALSLGGDLGPVDRLGEVLPVVVSERSHEVTGGPELGPIRAIARLSRGVTKKVPAGPNVVSLRYTDTQ